MKRKVSIISAIVVSIAVLLSTFVIFIGCKNSSKKAMSVKDMYALAVSAGASYFEEGGVSPAQYNATSRPTEIDGDIENLNKYVKMFEGYLLDGKTNVTTGGVQSTEIGTTYGDYTITENTIKQTVVLPTLSGVDVTYVMYFTETVVGQTSNYLGYEEIENEVNSSVLGVIVDGETFYKVTGSRETEKEIGEYETELTLKVLKSNTEFIVMTYGSEQEFNESEEEFEFEIWSGGTLVASTEIEFEKDGHKIELELEFNDDVPLAEKVSYNIKKDGNGFKVYYKKGNVRDSFTIKKVANGYEYTYSNGVTEPFN